MGLLVASFARLQVNSRHTIPRPSKIEALSQTRDIVVRVNDHHIVDQEYPLDIHRELASSIDAASRAYFQENRRFLTPGNIRVKQDSDRGFNVEVDCAVSGRLDRVATTVPKKVTLWVTQSPLL